MKKITLALMAILLFGVKTVKAQEQELSDSEPISTGCLSRSEVEEGPTSATIILTKEDSILSVDIFNYYSNCGTTRFEVENRLSGGNDDTPYSLDISVVPVIPAKMDCTCPFNISYTMRGMDKNKFFFSCWWYEGQVELTEGEPFVLEYQTDIAVIDSLSFRLLKVSHQAMLDRQKTWSKNSQILQIPSEIEYEGEKYTVSSMYENVFSSNNTIKQIIIPNTIKRTNGFGSAEEITKNPFSGCMSLETMEVEEGNPVISSIDGVLFNKDKTCLIGYPTNSPCESYTVPDNVTTFGLQAFSGNKRLKKVIMPYCVETLSYGTFYGCISLEEVILSSNIKVLPYNFCRNCNKLKSVVIPEGITIIDMSAFEGCYSLDSVSMPESVVRVGSAAFRDCTSLRSAKLSPNLKEISTSMFSNCSNLTEVIIPYGITNISNGAFYGCKAMQLFDLPESINYIDDLAFQELPNLKDFYCHATTVPNTKNNAFRGTDLKKATLHVPAASIADYEAKSPWNQFGTIVPLETQPDYRPMVEEGKVWKVFRSIIGSNPHFVQFTLTNEEVVKDGKTYWKMYGSEDDATVVYDAGLLREEDHKVYIYDTNLQEEYLMFDYSLKEGDTYQTYSYDEQKMVTYKVMSVSDYTEGPEVIYNYYDETADSLTTHHRYLRKWTVCRADNELLQKTWIEGVGSLEGPFGNLYDQRPNSISSYLTYVLYNDQQDYLPFSFYDDFNEGIVWTHGCNLPKGETEHSEDWHHQLNYELEGNRLHVYGKALTNCGPHSYAYFIEKPTDDPLVHKIEFVIQDVEPTTTCMALRATDFYVTGFDPALSYIIVDNQGEEHPVVNKAQQTAYRPMVEDGKVWKVGGVGSNPVQLVEYYYFDGDTIVDGKACKQMMRQRYVSPEHPDYDDVSQYPDLSYAGAWYEEDQRVYAYDSIANQFKLMYDFSLADNGTFLMDGLAYVLGPRQTGGIQGFKGVYRDVRLWADGDRIYSPTWLEGVGSIDGPTINVYPGYVDPAWFLMSCTLDDEVVYLNDEMEDGATPEGSQARNRFDFTHTIKTQPKVPMKREAEKMLYGEYGEQLLSINLDPLGDTYRVRITDETGKAVYEKTVNASNIVGLSINISAYPKGRYTVVVENSQESFVGEFETRTTGIEEIDLAPALARGEKAIFNLQGQRIGSLQKGLNIVNGQKVLVK